MRSVFLFALLALVAQIAALECTAGGEAVCHVNAFCDDGVTPNLCTCFDGYRGDGASCDGTGYHLKVIFADATARATFKDAACAQSTSVLSCLAEDKDWVNGGGSKAVLNIIAETAADLPASPGTAVATYGPYEWTMETTGSPPKRAQSGFEVDSVDFDTTCDSTGCWVIRITMSTGYWGLEHPDLVRGFNALYLPRAEGNDALSYDFDYSSTGSNDEWTFAPGNFPCDTDESDNNRKTFCCITNPVDNTADKTTPVYGGFLANYRATDPFKAYFAGEAVSNCGSLADPADDRIFWNSDSTGADIGFDGLTSSSGIVSVTAVDEYIGSYQVEIRIDEVDMRTKAGKLRGTVGVEHTVDTFLGLANFKPATNSVVLDSFVSQTAIHLEKTSFFTVSTHGTNDYTFLEYINLRLVVIYAEDTDFSDATGEVTEDFIRTNADNQAQYVQVTFTMGERYGVKPAGENAPLIPQDSVRVRGPSTFSDDGEMLQACDTYAANASLAQKFNTLLGQPCAPSAQMCVSPSSVPDNFVSFNIPLGLHETRGVTELGDYIGDGSNDLSKNIFVHFVVDAYDTLTACTANSEDEGCQFKTTVSASIPVVDGGKNIFCDGILAKTDLREVADADIVVGTANSLDELSRLTIKVNVTDSSLNAGDQTTQIDTVSIEASVMTLVLKGDPTYFLNNAGIAADTGVSLELEDVITLHVMADTGNGETAAINGDLDTTTDLGGIGDLLTADSADNTAGSELDTDGYALNGAFYFTIDRAAQRAHLEPTPALLALCPFNPPRPGVGASYTESCILRRDVRYRGYPFRPGSVSTAIEICAGVVAPDTPQCSGSTSSDEAKFFTSFLGDSTYARDLAVAHIQAIDDMYDLNGRYRRAYMINPGYEWTPAQTGGMSVFSLSQKVYMFALITLDENVASAAGNAMPASSYPNRRRMLLSSVDDAFKSAQGSPSGLGSTQLEIKTSPEQMLAQAYGVTADRVATFQVTMALTQAEVCMTDSSLISSLRDNLEDWVGDAATKIKTVQVLSMTVNRDNLDKTGCRRSLRALKSSLTSATVVAKFAVVFAEGAQSSISLAEIEQQPGVSMIEPLEVSPRVDTTKAEVDGSANDDKKSSSKSNVGMIAGIAGGGAAFLVLLIGGFLFMKNRTDAAQPVTAVQTINVEDLKSQLAGEV